MFGIFNLTREETLDGNEKKNENIDGQCYGGFSSRLDYEYCKNRKLHPYAALLYVAVFMFFVVTFGACGIVAYDFIQQNRPLYFPQNVGDTDQPETLTAVRSAVPMEEISFVSVTSDQSVRYRIPRGVMVKSTVTDKYEGLMTGDIIVAVNDLEIVDLDSLEKNCGEADGSITFRVFRQNRYIDVIVDPGK